MSELQGENNKSGGKDSFYWYVSNLVDEKLKIFFNEFSGLADFQKDHIRLALKLRLFEQPVHRSVMEKVGQNTAIQHWYDMGKVADLMKSTPAKKFLGSDCATAASLFESESRTNIDIYLETIPVDAALGIEEVWFNHRNVMRGAVKELLGYFDQCKAISDCYESGEFQKPPVRRGNPPKVRTAVLELCSEILFEYMNDGGYKIENIADLLTDLFSQVDGLGKAEFSKDLKKIESFYEVSEFKVKSNSLDYI